MSALAEIPGAGAPEASAVVEKQDAAICSGVAEEITARLTPGFDIIRHVEDPGDKVSYPSAGDRLAVHYTGSLRSTGEVFDCSRTRNK